MPGLLCCRAWEQLDLAEQLVQQAVPPSDQGRAEPVSKGQALRLPVAIPFMKLKVLLLYACSLIIMIMSDCTFPLHLFPLEMACACATLMTKVH